MKRKLALLAATVFCSAAFFAGPAWAAHAKHGGVHAHARHHHAHAHAGHHHANAHNAGQQGLGFIWNNNIP